MSTVIEKTNHNHKPNYGRYVNGCARCEEIREAKANVVPVPEATTAAPELPVINVVAPPPQVPVMTMEQVLEMIKALRAPSDEEIRKREEEKALQARRDREMIELARVEMEQKERLQSACSHRKDNGRTTLAGQVHSDGLYHPICLRCGYRPEPTAPAVGSIVGGLQ